LTKLKGKAVVNEAVPLYSIDPELLKLDVAPLALKLRNNRTAHTGYLRHTQDETATLKEIVESKRLLNPLNTSLDYASHTGYLRHTQDETATLKEIVESKRLLNPLNTSLDYACNTKNDRIQRAPSKAKKNKLEDHHRKVRPSLNKKESVVDTKANSSITNSKLNVNADLTCATLPLMEPIPIESNTYKPVVILVYSRKSKAAKKKVPFSNPTINKSLVANKTKPKKSWGSTSSNVPSSLIECMLSKLSSDLEVTFHQHTCFIRNLNGVDLLTSSRGNNLYTLSLQDMIASSHIFLLSKASKTKYWLWHHRLSHLNFGAINHLARQSLVRGLSKLKFEKDHLCLACAMGKSTKKSHKPKSEDTNHEKLYLLHMDLCGPMRVESVNGKKYIIVIVDDYLRFTWVKFLRSKDKGPDFIIKFMRMIQVRLKVSDRRIRTDNGTEFVNQMLRDYYEEVGISHETSVARSPQHNGVVERRNRTLSEAARTMLIYT
nr:retrovirus-related Pol polyprotein from transposon TNT 1-94 [Tanacetum cinerariifolium]